MNERVNERVNVHVAVDPWVTALILAITFVFCVMPRIERILDRLYPEPAQLAQESTDAD